MRIYTLLLAALIGSALYACSDSNQTATPEAPASPPQDKVLFESQLQALEKAKGVENILQQGAQHNNESLEQQYAPPQ